MWYETSVALNYVYTEHVLNSWVSRGKVEHINETEIPYSVPLPPSLLIFPNLLSISFASSILPIYEFEKWYVNLLFYNKSFTYLLQSC